MPIFKNPFRNLRLSAANDVCRLEGITTKTVTEWFGHDIATALKHYYRVTESDFQLAIEVDPFADRSKDRRGICERQGDVNGDVSTPEHKNAQSKNIRENESLGSMPENSGVQNYAFKNSKKEKNDPYGVNLNSADTVFTDSNQPELKCDVKSDVTEILADPILAELLEIWPRLNTNQKQQVVKLADRLRTHSV